jgi:hypothetical protein
MTSRVIPRPDGNGFDTVPVVVAIGQNEAGESVSPLTNTELRATPVNVGATARTCLGTFRLSVTSTAATLPALIMAVGGAGIPAGAVVVELQADGGTVRLSRDNTVTPTTTTGYRLDDGAVLNVDSTLSHVRLIAAATTPVNCTFFDRV